MRIHCPFCGERDSGEFTYLGAASDRNTAYDAPDAGVKLFEAIYLRVNPAGPNDELWYHAFGCRSWLRVTRDTRTHEVFSVKFAKDPS